MQSSINHKHLKTSLFVS